MTPINLSIDGDPLGSWDGNWRAYGRPAASKFSIYLVTPDGGASWTTGRAVGDNAEDALNRFARSKPDLIREGRTYLVIEPNVNGNGAQALFRWETPPPVPQRARAVPASLSQATTR